MAYTIKQVSEMTGIPASTLRYYDQEGLFPFLKRQETNYRVFEDIDLATLQIIQCLKSIGMSLDDIRKFSDWTMQGDATLEQRRDMFADKRIDIENQIAKLQKALDIINYKYNYYQKAVAAGTEKFLYGKDRPPHFDEFLTPICKD